MGGISQTKASRGAAHCRRDRNAAVVGVFNRRLSSARRCLGEWHVCWERLWPAYVYFCVGIFFVDYVCQMCLFNRGQRESDFSFEILSVVCTFFFPHAYLQRHVDIGSKCRTGWPDLKPHHHHNEVS